MPHRKSYSDPEVPLVTEPNREFIQRHFDVIAVNVRGAQEVKWVDGAAYTEKTLARRLKVYGTPTTLFLDPEGKVALRLTGYQSPGAVHQALEYVHDGRYRTQPSPGGRTLP